MFAQDLCCEKMQFDAFGRVQKRWHTTFKMKINFFCVFKCVIKSNLAKSL